MTSKVIEKFQNRFALTCNDTITTSPVPVHYINERKCVVKLVFCEWANVCVWARARIDANNVGHISSSRGVERSSYIWNTSGFDTRQTVIGRERGARTHLPRQNVHQYIICYNHGWFVCVQQLNWIGQYGRQRLVNARTSLRPLRAVLCANLLRTTPVNKTSSLVPPV